MATEPVSHAQSESDRRLDALVRDVLRDAARRGRLHVAYRRPVGHRDDPFEISQIELDPHDGGVIIRVQ